MGLPMAEALHAGGFDVAGFDIEYRDEHRQSPVPMLAHPCEHDADVAIIVVRDRTELDALCFDVQALFAEPPYPTRVIVSSTLAVGDVHALVERLPGHCRVVDAPMSGAPVAARERRLSFMIGGDAMTVDWLAPLFDAMGTNRFYLGGSGSGMAVKVLNNTVAACSVAVVRRVLADADAQNIDPQALLTVMRASSGATWFGDHIESIDWSRQDYDARNTIGILEKDVRCALNSVSRQPDAFDRALLEALRQLPPFPDNSRNSSRSS